MRGMSESLFAVFLFFCFLTPRSSHSANIQQPSTMQQNEAMNIVLTERLADIDLKTGACRCYNNIIIVRPSTCQKERNDYNSNHNFKS